jgi:tartrate-resistant acid phosphatase type 5
MDSLVSRRRFLRQTCAFSALAALGSMPGLAAPRSTGMLAVHLLMLGDWGYDRNHGAQASVAAGMRNYSKAQFLRIQALLMLGDNWYGALDGGAKSERWQIQFEQMYPEDPFDCPAYAILGNHDYQNWPASKVDSELEYARTGRSRWRMPSRWYRFGFPERDPLITFIALGRVNTN